MTRIPCEYGWWRITETEACVNESLKSLESIGQECSQGEEGIA
jgi:hypothetical protein